MTLLAFDIGLGGTGYVVLSDPWGTKITAAGAILTEADPRLSVAQATWDRAGGLGVALGRLMDDHRPALVVGEAPHLGAKSARALRAMAVALGVAATATALRGVPTHLVTPAQVRKVCGDAEDKRAVWAYVQPRFEWPEPMPTQWYRLNHVADAAAVVLAWRAQQGGAKPAKPEEFI